METEGIEVIEVELKYCERCGGLWLRRKGVEQVYCFTCERALADFPQATAKSTRAKVTTCAEDLESMAEYGILCPEGHA